MLPIMSRVPPCLSRAVEAFPGIACPCPGRCWAGSCSTLGLTCVSSAFTLLQGLNGHWMCNETLSHLHHIDCSSRFPGTFCSPRQLGIFLHFMATFELSPPYLGPLCLQKCAVANNTWVGEKMQFKGRIRRKAADYPDTLFSLIPAFGFPLCCSDRYKYSWRDGTEGGGRVSCSVWWICCWR